MKRFSLKILEEEWERRVTFTDSFFNTMSLRPTTLHPPFSPFPFRPFPFPGFPKSQILRISSLSPNKLTLAFSTFSSVESQVSTLHSPAAQIYNQVCLLDSHLFSHVLLCRRGHVFFLAVYSVVVVVVNRLYLLFYMTNNL